MNRKIFTGFVCVLFVLMCSPAFAAGNFYVTPQVGVTFLNDADISDNGVAFGTVGFDAGYGAGISGGYDFGVIRLEGEAGYRKNDLDTISIPGEGEFPIPGETTALSLLLNCFVDFETGTGFTPYAGAGIGVAKVEFEASDEDISEDDTVFAYQFVAGVGYAVAENVTLDVSYRYFATADPTFDDGGDEIEMEYGSHNIFMGVRFSF
ncbi:MAG: outer membrane protein [Thermodesulfobacteriota bacterium]|nr:outer membrane protein [Thermodesulfobacteriota bacterium]